LLKQGTATLSFSSNFAILPERERKREREREREEGIHQDN
jgi:hypothetical protein